MRARAGAAAPVWRGGGDEGTTAEPGLTVCTGAAMSRWTQTPGQSKPMCEAMKRPAQELGLLSLSWGDSRTQGDLSAPGSGGVGRGSTKVRSGLPPLGHERAPHALSTTPSSATASPGGCKKGPQGQGGPLSGDCTEGPQGPCMWVKGSAFTLGRRGSWQTSRPWSAKGTPGACHGGCVGGETRERHVPALDASNLSEDLGPHWGGETLVHTAAVSWAPRGQGSACCAPRSMGAAGHLPPRSSSCRPQPR